MNKIKETLFTSTILEKQLLSYDMERSQTQVYTGIRYIDRSNKMAR